MRSDSGRAPPSPSRLGGPFDRRRGYSLIPEFQDRLQARGYQVVEQARQSAEMARLMALEITPPYRETPSAGLQIRAQGMPIHDVRPQRGFYQRLEDVPPLVVNTLLYIENRDLARAPGSPQQPGGGLAAPGQGHHALCGTQGRTRQPCRGR